MSRAALIILGLTMGATPALAEPEVIANLGRFLENFIGDCTSDDPSFDRVSCEAEVNRFREGKRGRTFTVHVDDATQHLAFAGWDERRMAYRLHLTPFFSGRDRALTIGKPKARRSDGQPEVKNLPIWIKRPKGESDLMFRRMLERGLVRLEMVVEPRHTWALRRRGQAGYFQGVNAKLKKLRIRASRSDRILAEQKY